MMRKSILLAAVASVVVTVAAGAQEPDKYAQGRLSWNLHRIATDAERGGPLRAAGRRFVNEGSGRVTAVAELVEHADPGELAAFVAELGGRVEAVAEQVGWVKLSLAPGALRRAAEHPSVARLRTPYYPSALTELLPVGVYAGGSRVILRWDDLHGSSGHDYDLYIVRQEFAADPVFEDNPAIVTSSRDLQAGAGNPLEIVDIQVEEDEILYAVVRRDPASPPAPEQRFWLWSEGTVHPDYRSSEGTLAIPADARGSLAVGAVNVDGLTLEPFSSRGPTDDGRVKPDLVAPDGVSTASYGPSAFFGTSAATPHVAAAAALIVSLHPGVVGEPLRRAVERATATGGVEDEKNNEVGYGLLDLTKAR